MGVTPGYAFKASRFIHKNNAQQSLLIGLFWIA
jgi:hypothetical protein